MSKSTNQYVRAAKLLQRSRALRERSEQAYREAVRAAGWPGQGIHGWSEYSDGSISFSVPLERYLAEWPDETPKPKTYVLCETGDTMTYLEYPLKWVGDLPNGGNGEPSRHVWVDAKTPSVVLESAEDKDAEKDKAAAEETHQEQQSAA